MRHGWVMEVLSDLRRFADEQQMHELKSVLASAAQIAALELANAKPEAGVHEEADPMARLGR